MTKDQIKQIVRLTEAVVAKKLNEAVSNTLEGIIEKRAYEELKSIMPDKDINILSKLINKIDARADNSKDYDGNEFFNHVENLSGYFPIDTVKDLFDYLNEYISTVDDNMVNPPSKVTAAIRKLIKNTKLTETIVDKRLNESAILNLQQITRQMVDQQFLYSTDLQLKEKLQRAIKTAIEPILKNHGYGFTR